MGNLSAHLLHVILKMKSINFPWGNFCKVGLNVSYVLGERCLNCLYVIKSKLAQKLYYSNAEAESREAETSRHEKLWAGETMQRSQKAAGACLAEPSSPKGAGSGAAHGGAAGREQGKAYLHHSPCPAAAEIPWRTGATLESQLVGHVNQGWKPESTCNCFWYLRRLIDS